MYMTSLLTDIVVLSYPVLQLWSLTLVAWPLIIFIIIAVTRNQFPPVQKDICKYNTARVYKSALI